MAEDFIFDLPIPDTLVIAEEMRRNLNALGVTNITPDPALPRNPREGMLRILTEYPSNVRLQFFFSSSWVTILTNIQAGISVVQRLEFNFVNLQQWIIDHNLGQYPIVQVFRNDGQIITPSTMQHASVNRVIVEHGAPKTGTAIIIG